MIKVMVADDNTILNNQYCNFLTQDKDIEIISSTTDGEVTLQQYNKLQPDVLLLDLDLPTLSGIDIINTLGLNKNEKKKKNIIVVSGYDSFRLNLYDMAKVFRVIPKGEGFEPILSAIKDLSELNTINFTDKDLRSLLYSLNFNLYYDGTTYLIDAIQIAYENPYLLKNIKNVYEKVAEKHSVSDTTIKWSIRNSIDTMNHNTSNKDICSRLNVPYSQKMTPKNFIPLVVSYFS